MSLAVLYFDFNPNPPLRTHEKVNFKYQWKQALQLHIEDGIV